MPSTLPSPLPQAPKLVPESPGPPPHIAGVDEAGRGPWAGPVVAAAVILPHRCLSVRIDDSKRLTSRQRERAFHVILERAEVGFGIVCAQEIDRRNILQATWLAMVEAIRDLPTIPDLVFVDGHLAPPISIPCRPVVRGDQRIYVISCASIMAKVLRDRLMSFYHELEPRYEFHRHKGYGTALHAHRLSAHGPCVLHRRSFRPVAESILAGPATEPGHPAQLGGRPARLRDPASRPHHARTGCGR